MRTTLAPVLDWVAFNRMHAVGLAQRAMRDQCATGGNDVPAFVDDVELPDSCKAPESCGSAPAADSSAVRSRISSGVTSTFSKLLPSVVFSSATISLRLAYVS